MREKHDVKEWWMSSPKWFFIIKFLLFWWSSLVACSIKHVRRVRKTWKCYCNNEYIYFLQHWWHEENGPIKIGKYLVEIFLKYIHRPQLSQAENLIKCTILPANLPYRWNIRSTSVFEHWNVLRFPTNIRLFTACGSCEFVWFDSFDIFILS